MQVALLYGGMSAEHKVSIESAKTIMKVLKKGGHQVFPIAIDLNGHWFLQQEPIGAIRDYRNEILVHPGEGLFLDGKKLGIDVAFPVTHGHNGEDGRLQGLLALAGIPCAGCDTLASAVMMYKAIAQHLFRQAGIPTIKTYVIQADTIRQCVEDGDFTQELAVSHSVCGKRLFIKPEDGGSSIGVTALASPTEETFADAVLRARKYGERVLVQQLLIGAMEVECAVLEDPSKGIVVSPPGLVEIPGGNLLSYDLKYRATGGDRLVTPAPIPMEDQEKIMEYARRAFLVGKCHGYLRADFFYKKGKIWINESNTLPGMTGTSHYPVLIAQCGYTLEDCVEIILLDALEQARNEMGREYVPPEGTL